MSKFWGFLMNVMNKLRVCLEESGIVILDDGSFDEMDSITFISAIVSIEQEFEIEFLDEYLIMNVMGNIDQLYEVVSHMINDKVGLDCK